MPIVIGPRISPVKFDDAAAIGGGGGPPAKAIYDRFSVAITDRFGAYITTR